MKDCICGNRALYFCKPHQVAVCKKHKVLHEEGNEREHINEKFGQNLTAQRLAKIVQSLSLKIKIAENVQSKFEKELREL